MIEFTKAELKKGSLFDNEATDKKVHIPLKILKECVFEQEQGCWRIQYFTFNSSTSWRVIENPNVLLEGQE